MQEESKEINFVEILKDHHEVIFNKSQLPEMRRRKSAAVRRTTFVFLIPVIILHTSEFLNILETCIEPGRVAASTFENIHYY